MTDNGPSTGGMRLPDAEHTARPWRIHEIAPDFEVEDVWAFRTPGGGPDDFPVTVAVVGTAATLIAATVLHLWQISRTRRPTR